MAYSVGWSPRAIADVDGIAGYISRDSATYASSIVGKILGATRNLSAFPHIGASGAGVCRLNHSRKDRGGLSGDLSH
jgi:plasmid stabilization system protein ParE